MMESGLASTSAISLSTQYSSLEAYLLTDPTSFYISPLKTLINNFLHMNSSVIKGKRNLLQGMRVNNQNKGEGVVSAYNENCFVGISL